MPESIRVLTAFGTRPEAIKMAPLVHRLADCPGVEPIVCVTAQHRQMLDQVLQAFSIEPHVDLDLMKAGQDLFDVTAGVLCGMKSVLREWRPDVVLVHGDTTTTFAVSLAAFYEQIRLGHVEAGLRTRDKRAPFPEEINRQLTTRMADDHYAPTSRSKSNLVEELVPEPSIHIVGNTAIDALFWMIDRLHEHPREVPGLDLADSNQRVVLITAHRRESFGAGFESLCLALSDLAARFPDVLFVYPVHLNPNVQDPVRRHLGGIANIQLIEPLPYPLFVGLMERSYLILTDSGGIQEEAPSLGKPVLVLREITERPEAVDAGTVVLVGTDRERIVAEASRLLEDEEVYKGMGRKINPYGDGRAAERIVNQILTAFGRVPHYAPPPLAVT